MATGSPSARTRRPRPSTSCNSSSARTPPIDGARLNSGILPTTVGSEASVTDPTLKGVLDGRAKAEFVQLYLDQATTPALGGAINEAVATLYAGTGTPEQVAKAIHGAARPVAVVDRPVNGPAARRPVHIPRDDQRGDGRRPRPRSGRQPARVAAIGLFLLPALALYAVFVLFPIVQAARYSLFNWNGLEPLDQFIGLANYQRALADPVFLGAVRHNVFIIVLSLAIQIPFALGWR